MSLKEQIDNKKLPTHIAIIMDGNGRWAKQRGLDRIFGHQQGVNAVRNVIEASAELGIKYLTLYAFSTENWGRPDEEVNALMNIMIQSLNKETDTLLKNNIRMLTIGDTGRLSDDVRERLDESINLTSGCTGLNLIIAISYSSRWEILEAAKQIATQVKSGKIGIDQIDEQVFENFLSTKDIPDPDLMVRTSGEKRISNFLLWQMAYTELYISEILWPDFSKEHLYEAVIDYQKRERRFGRTSEQIDDN